MIDLPEACQHVADAAVALGLGVEIQVPAQSARTAAEAAIARKCGVCQIVKSLEFRGAASGKPYLLLVSGANRVDEAGVASAIAVA